MQQNEPRVGCGAYIQDINKKVLLVKRRRDPEAGSWGFPGGKVDFGETTKQATIREIKEELGLRIEVRGLAHLVEFIDTQNREHWLAPVYHASIQAGTPLIKEPEAIAELKWFDLSALPNQLTEATRQTLNPTPVD
ncbi:NUDIX domain-containing protein [Sneathiella aquimaris]|uniref:NUDIX domain-containing protein n=1 Tax=Sneathiella aquimaris TaxID=2599305 RepID=UPI00146DF6A6|nr:NUDIX domain-containing protein [Sneathiella aquimaris]